MTRKKIQKKTSTDTKKIQEKKNFHCMYQKTGFYFLIQDIKILLFGSCNKVVDKLATYQLISELNSLQCKLRIKPNISEAKSERFTD